MRRLLSLLLFVSSLAWADTTSNLITNTPGISGTGVWTGIGGYSQLNGQHPTTLWGCCTSYSGSAPFMDTSTGSPNGQSGQFIWSYGQATVAQIIAVNQALAGVGAGVQISGYNWGYEVRNMNGYSTQGGVDTLTATTFMTSNTGTRILQDTRVYNTRSDWNWYGGTVTAASPIDLANTGHLGIEFTSSDSGFWAGYYGPQVRNVDLSLNYTAAPVDPCVSDPQSSPSCPGYKTYYTMWDDGYARVDLPFAFPFYGQVFTTSYMYTNGVVGFLNNNWGFCCNGTDLNNQTLNANSPWNYAIYALNTDLIPGPNSRFYTQKTDNNTGMKYTWEIVPEIGTSLNNTFSVQIKDSGFIGLSYDQVNLNDWRQPLIGIAGDISQGQFQQVYYGPASGLSALNLTTPAASGWKYTFTGTETTDVCAQNPLFNSSCPGYAQAYYNQQCSLNPLYAATCPGYETAYYNQQCSINPLYAVTCPGYEAAYLNQQCSLNPLYSASCTGYQAATEACSANPLTANYCPGYATATAECNVNSLLYTYCPNYQTALAACSTDAQSNTLCPGYSTTTASTDTSSTVTATTVSTTEPTVSVKDDGTVKTSVAIVADSAVNSVLTKNTETTAAVAAAQEPVVVASASTTAAPTTTVSAPSATEQKATAAAVESVVAAVETRETANADTKADTEKKDGESKEKTSSSNKSDSKSDTKSKAEARREAVKRAATEKAKELANDMSRAATIEAQTASQATVLGLMNYTPGFDSYNNAIVPDVNARAMAKQYNRDNVDNRNVMRRLNGASERLHQEMVDQQYQLRR